MKAPTATLFGVTAAVITSVQVAAAGSIYACRDLSGRAHSADRPVAECAQTVMRELRNDGLVRREIQASLTSDQLRRQEADALKRQAEEAARREQHLRDRALLMTYPTESVLEQAKAREITRLRQEIESSISRILAFDRESKAVKARIDPSRRAVPESLQLEIRQIASEILTEDAIVQLKREQIIRTEARYEDTRRRLHQLLSSVGSAQ